MAPTIRLRTPVNSRSHQMFFAGSAPYWRRLKSRHSLEGCSRLPRLQSGSAAVNLPPADASSESRIANVINTRTHSYFGEPEKGLGARPDRRGQALIDA